MVKNISKEVNEVLYRLNVGSTIPLNVLENAFRDLLLSKDDFRDVQMGAILTGITARGAKVEEIRSLLLASFSLDNFNPRSRIKVDLPNGESLISAIGTGKKGFKTMNISTPSLFLAAACGVYVAKPVSNSTSSLTGSTNILEELGVNLNIPVEDMIEVIKKTHFGAFSIEHTIPNFNAVYGGKFFVPHALSFGLAGLVSPVKFDSILYGVAHPDIETAIDVLHSFGQDNVLAVSTTNDGIHYLDELGIYGTTKIIGILDGKVGPLVHFRPTEELGLQRYTPDDIGEGKSIEENVSFVVDVLRGKGELAREDIVCINAGTLLYLAKKVTDLKDGYAIAKEVIKTGKVIEILKEVIVATGGDMSKLERFLK